MSAAIVVGNADRDGEAYRGWFVGHFVPEAAGARSTGDVEVKWGVHRAGEVRDGWASSEHATSLSVLLQGRYRLFFPERAAVVLARSGDYALWPAGVPHRWEIDEDSVILTVRWPSRA